ARVETTVALGHTRLVPTLSSTFVPVTRDVPALILVSRTYTRLDLTHSSSSASRTWISTVAYWSRCRTGWRAAAETLVFAVLPRSEEHTSELQSHSDLVCRLLLEKSTSDRTIRSTQAWREQSVYDEVCSRAW